MYSKISFVFRDKKQQDDWEEYLEQVGETHQEALMNLIDTAIRDNKDLNEDFENRDLRGYEFSKW